MRRSRSAVRALLACIAVVALLAGAAPAQADTWIGWTTSIDIAPSGARIAHPYIERTDGGGLTLLGTTRGTAINAVGSADGRVSAYTVQRVRGSVVRSGLVVVVDGAARDVLVDGVQGLPFVSVDGRTVAVGRKGGDVTGYDVGSRTLRTLCHRCTGFATSGEGAGVFERVAVSPNARYVAVRSFPSGIDGRGLLIYRIADNRRIASATYGEDESDAAMSWTPDSRSVAYVRTELVGTSARGRVGLLGIDGRVRGTPIWAPGEGWFAGPLYLRGAWYLTFMPGLPPSGRTVQVWRTTSLSKKAVRVGTIRTEAHPDTAFVGQWWVAEQPPTTG